MAPFEFEHAGRSDFLHISMEFEVKDNYRSSIHIHEYNISRWIR